MRFNKHMDSVKHLPQKKLLQAGEVPRRKNKFFNNCQSSPRGQGGVEGKVAKVVTKKNSFTELISIKGKMTPQGQPLYSTVCGKVFFFFSRTNLNCYWNMQMWTSLGRLSMHALVQNSRKKQTNRTAEGSYVGYDGFLFQETRQKKAEKPCR